MPCLHIERRWSTQHRVLRWICCSGATRHGTKYPRVVSRYFVYIYIFKQVYIVLSSRNSYVCQDIAIRNIYKAAPRIGAAIYVVEFTCRQDGRPHLVWVSTYYAHTQTHTTALPDGLLDMCIWEPHRAQDIWRAGRVYRKANAKRLCIGGTKTECETQRERRWKVMHIALHDFI